VDEPHSSEHCGRCSLHGYLLLLFVPYVLDARRCISYLTIELKGNPHRSARANRQPGVRLR
jgi:epoxyqueuosine reductase